MLCLSFCIVKNFYRFLLFCDIAKLRLFDFLCQMRGSFLRINYVWFYSVMKCFVVLCDCYVFILKCIVL